MDSLTQIALGAAVGELVLGRKIGNRAIFWGAIGGTLPDMDVVANFSADEMGALAFHRAATHTLLFAALAPLGLGWLTHRLYRPQHPPTRMLADLGWLWLGLAALIGLAAVTMPMPPLHIARTAVAVAGAMTLFPAVVYVWHRYGDSGPTIIPNPSAWQWTGLFFLVISTHPLLDCFTTYGTQVLQPFSDYRVGWDNISVVDPLYTLPLLIGLSVAARYPAGHRGRVWANGLGLLLASVYMVWTFSNKAHVEQVFRDSLAREGIVYERLMTSPTIFNNVLWHGVAEGDSVYYVGLYALTDQAPEVVAFRALPKGHSFVQKDWESRPVQILRWFSDGYFIVRPIPDGRLFFSDLRFGTLATQHTNGGQEPTFVFRFLLDPHHPDGLTAKPSRAAPPGGGAAFGQLFERMKGQ